MSDRQRIEECGAKLTTKQDQDGFNYSYIQMDEDKREWFVRVHVVRVYGISVFADNASEARYLAESMQTLQFEDEGSLEYVEVTGIYLGNDDDGEDDWDDEDDEEDDEDWDCQEDEDEIDECGGRSPGASTAGDQPDNH